MSFKNDGIYTQELNSVLNYMVDILVNEFPTDLFTSEFLMVSIFDIKNCHANMILDNCLMSNNMEELKEIYISVLKENITPNINKIDKENIIFDDELNEILNKAEIERDKTNSKLIGTEHVLLSILNPKNKFKVKDVFNTVGIEYQFIYDKCLENKPKRPKQIKSKTLKNKKDILKSAAFPLKSDVNATLVGSKNEFIPKYTVNLNQLVKDKKIDKLIGRQREMNEIIKVLGRRKKNNVILVGNGGVGKTSIINGLAYNIVNNNVPSLLEDKEILMIDVMSLVSGTHFRGMFEERVKGLFDELKNSKKYILFFDDMQNVLKTGTKEKDTDLSGMIGDILSEGDVRIIGTTTFKDYRNAIETNTSISRKLQKIVIEAPNQKESIDILLKSKKYYEDYHNVKYSDEAITRAVELADRYITDRCLPDSAFDIIDLAGAATNIKGKEPSEIVQLRKRLSEIEEEKNKSLNNGDFEKIDEFNAEENKINAELSDFKRKVNSEKSKNAIIGEEDIAKTVSDLTNIPVTKMTLNEKKKIAHIDEILKNSVIGQDEAINAICKVIKRNKVGLGDKKKTKSNILMVGGSGCGKTLIAKKLAEEIFGSESALVRIDMSEYSEKNSVAKLTGAAPGYVGYENGGQLTEAIKNKQHCVLLLDEIEKADQEVYNLFLQLFDEGRLTDSSGQIVNFKNVIVLMTSNVGAKQASDLGNGVGFNTDKTANQKSIIEKSLKKKFTPEFLNRIDKIVYFNNLTDDNLNSIVKLEVEKLNKRLNEIHYSLNCDANVINFIQSKAIEQKEYGARPIIRLVQDNIEDKITDLLLENDYKQDYVFNATFKNNEVVIN